MKSIFLEKLSDCHRLPLRKNDLFARQHDLHLFKSEKTAAYAYETNTQN